MKRTVLAAITALVFSMIVLPAIAEAQPGRGRGIGNSPAARRMKMERKIRRERQKFRRKAERDDQRYARRSRVYRGPQVPARRPRVNDPYYNGPYSNDPYYNGRYGNDPYYNQSGYYDPNYNPNYDPYYDPYYRRGNVYDRHRNVINIGIGAGAGAVVGGIVGGKKGALIGAGVGAAAGAVYTYGINRKDRRRPRYYRDDR